MADVPKLETRSGGDDEFGTASLTAILERMHVALEERARPILEEMRAIQQLLDKLREDEFLQERRRLRAAQRQSTMRPPESPAAAEVFQKRAAS